MSFVHPSFVMSAVILSVSSDSGYMWEFSDEIGRFNFQLALLCCLSIVAVQFVIVF